MEYDVPDEIKILPTDQEISVGPDSFDSILLYDRVGTQGTLGTVLEGMDEGTNKRGDSQIASEIRDTEDSIQPENSPTHLSEASPPSPQFECYYCKQRFPSQSELIAHMDKE
jgi:hypothetical protein